MVEFSEESHLLPARSYYRHEPRTALAGKLLHEPPGLPGMHVEFAGLVHAIQRET